MREIKFRAWSEEFGMMFYPNVGEEQFEDLVGEKGSPKCGLMQPQGSLSYMHSQRSPIMQYTGLKDKNGKEIFEGDLIINLSRNNRKPHEVVFGYGCYLGNYRDLKYVIGHELDEISVIGNIHENKGLL